MLNIFYEMRTGMTIPVLTLVVQVLGLLGLLWYVTETMKIRRASQKQVEGMSKPCLTFWGELRDGTDAILEMHGAVGNIVAAADGGSYVVLNIGNGVALNIRYRPLAFPSAPTGAIFLT